MIQERRASIALLALFFTLAAPTAADATDLTLQNVKVSPKQFFLESETEVRIEFRVEAAAPVDVLVRVLDGEREVRRFLVGDVPPGADRAVSWDGLAGGGRPAADGKYRVLIGAPGGPEKLAGTVVLRGHTFPVLGPHGTRGGIGRFGAPRSGGRVHEGFDVVASCGRPLVAARAGRVIRRGFDPNLHGNYLLIRGLGERRSYFYAHMVRPAEVKRGEEVQTGERVGRIGLTGNARSTPCHLHFEIHLHGHRINPEPSLRSWDRFSQRRKPENRGHAHLLG